MEIKTIECSPKDTIVIQFRTMHDYTVEDLCHYFENLQNALPNPVVFIPEEVIKDITVISSEPKYLEMVKDCGRPQYDYPFSAPSTGGKDLW